jgi:hypothetical protein
VCVEATYAAGHGAAHHVLGNVDVDQSLHGGFQRATNNFGRNDCFADHVLPSTEAKLDQGDILPVDCSWLFISAEVARQTQNLHFGERSLNNFQRKFGALKQRIKISENKFIKVD